MLKRIKIIFITELLQILKDKRTVIAMFVIPMLMLPAILNFAITVNEKQEIHLITENEIIYDKILKNNKLINKYNIIRLKPEQINQNSNFILFEHNNNEFIFLMLKKNQKIEKDFQDFFKRYPEIAFKTDSKSNIESHNNTYTDKLENAYSGIYSVIVIFLIVCFSGPALVASDISAGEKERKTLESLLMSKCPPYIIYTGKFLLVLVFSLLPLFFGILSLLILNHTVFNTQSFVYESGLIIKIVLPYCFFMSAFLLKNGFKARTVRAAKSTESLFFVIILIVNIFALLSNHLNIVYTLIPVLNSVLFALNPQSIHIVTYYLSYIIITSLLIRKTILQIGSEDVLFTEN